MENDIYEELFSKINNLENSISKLEKEKQKLLSDDNLNQIATEIEENDLPNSIFQGDFHKISYFGETKYPTLQILGDFTGWIEKPMTKENDNWVFETFLISGFKYYYRFKIGEEIEIDFMVPSELNSKTQQIDNFIEVHGSETFNLSQEDVSSTKIAYFFQASEDKDTFLALRRLANFSDRFAQKKEEETNKFTQRKAKIDEFYQYIFN